MTTLKTAIKAIPVLTMLLLGAYTLSHAQAPKIAEQYLSQALAAQESGYYLEAARLYKKFAEEEQKSPEPRLDVLSAVLGHAALCYVTVGQYDKALKYFEEALAIYRELGKNDKVADYLNNIGFVYKSWGQYGKALKNYEEALAIDRELGREADVGTRLNNIGGVYDSWGQYEKAHKYYEEALAIARKLGQKAELAIRINNIGGVYDSLGQYEKAIECFEAALFIFRKLGPQHKVATCLNNIGTVYISQEQYDKALKYFEEALTIDRKLGKEDSVSTSLGNIGWVYYSWGQYDKALEYYEEALDIAKKLGMEDAVSIKLGNMGRVYYSLNQYNKAIDSLRASITIKEKLRITATGIARRDYLESQIMTYYMLINAYLRNNDIPNAFSAMEISRAKLLAERLAGSYSIAVIPSIRSIQLEMPSDTAIIYFANSTEDIPVALVITKDNTVSAELDKKKFIDSIQHIYSHPIKQLLARQRGLKVISKSTERDPKPQDKASTSLDDVVNYYRSLLADSSSVINQSSRGLVVRSKPTYPRSEARLDRLLHDFLIKPLTQQLKGKKRLIIIPHGVLAYIPFEILVDENNRYLVEKYIISYTQSIGVMEILKKRTYSAGRKSMLAFGGAVYDEVSYTVDMITNEQQLLALAKDVYATTRSRGVLGTAYASLGIVEWDNLPNTLSEVKAIAKTVKGAKVVTGSDVTESSVKQLSASGELSKYKVIHFATHGIVVPEIPELSAIVLSQLKNQPAGEDGYLRMDEIEELRMKADFVNLSACETGLGKIFGGEGVVGLTQSFLLAGANGLSVSLWKVNDMSTSQFMVALYSIVEQKKIGYGDAITEIKRGFIQGKFGEAYKAPYYWAPFVYYGKL